SHTSTHGAFGALAFGIGTSEVEHVLATQSLREESPKTLKEKDEGDLEHGVTDKDLIMAIISKFGVRYVKWNVIEYTSETIRKLSIEERMTVCNMSIEAGARAGLISPDEKTIDYLFGKRYVPIGEEFTNLAEEWRALATDKDAVYDQTVT